MREIHNESTHNRPEGDRNIDAPIIAINLPNYIRQIKEEDAWHKNDRNAITLYKTDGMRIVLTALRKDAEMAPHKTDGIISVQVLEGKIKFTAGGQSISLNEGQIVTLHEHIVHSVRAIEETVFLLTIAHS